MPTPITNTMVSKALAKVSRHPLKTWSRKGDTIVAINTIGQKFTFTIETINLNDLMDKPRKSKSKSHAHPAVEALKE